MQPSLSLMPSHRSYYEDPNLAVAWAPGGLPRARLYLLEGSVHVVAQQSPAEQQLVEHGAFPVADLTFEAPTPRKVDATVHAADVHEAAKHYSRLSIHN
jgi:hypothetical protein